MAKTASKAASRKRKFVYAAHLKRNVGDAPVGREGAGRLDLARLDIDPDHRSGGDGLCEAEGNRSGSTAAVE